MKFRNDSDLESCGKAVTHGGCECACMRVRGHQPPCVALACDAAAADGRRHCCWTKITEMHAVEGTAMSTIQDEPMQLVVEIAAMNPMEVHQDGDQCYFCGVETSYDAVVEDLVLDHVPFCSWLCRKLAEPWLSERDKQAKFGGIMHREAVAE